MRLRSLVKDFSKKILVKIARPVVLEVFYDELRLGKGSGLKSMIISVMINEIRIWGDSKRLKISPKAKMTNTLFNTASGEIEVGDYTFTGHNVCIITGTHHYESFLDERMRDIPPTGNDIKIGKGVWIGSNAIILGPCNIGDHAVISAGSVVIEDTTLHHCCGSTCKSSKKN